MHLWNTKIVDTQSYGILICLFVSGYEDVISLFIYARNVDGIWVTVFSMNRGHSWGVRGAAPARQTYDLGSNPDFFLAEQEYTERFTNDVTGAVPHSNI